jgi:predicted CoA-binding protein
LTDAAKILHETSTVVVVDWPSREVPEALLKAGLNVIVKGGPGPGDFTTWRLANGQITTQNLGRPPEHADLVYFHRPVSEMPSIIRLAQDVGAQALWRQSGLTPDGAKSPRGCWVAAEESRQGRDLATAAGLGYVDNVYIPDALRAPD